MLSENHLLAEDQGQVSQVAPASWMLIRYSKSLLIFSVMICLWHAKAQTSKKEPRIGLKLGKSEVQSCETPTPKKPRKDYLMDFFFCSYIKQPCPAHLAIIYQHVGAHVEWTEFRTIFCRSQKPTGAYMSLPKMDQHDLFDWRTLYFTDYLSSQCLSEIANYI